MASAATHVSSRLARPFTILLRRHFRAGLISDIDWVYDPMKQSFDTARRQPSSWVFAAMMAGNRTGPMRGDVGLLRFVRQCLLLFPYSDRRPAMPGPFAVPCIEKR